MAEHPTAPPARPPGRCSLVVMGASAGAVEALSAILPALPAGFALPILVVVHLPPDKRSALPELFAAKSRLRVKEAEDKEPIEAGFVYFAPPNYHLLVEREGCLSLCGDEPVLYSRPSIDVLFESAADAFGGAVAGVVLTGGNSDGAKGLRAIQRAGGLAIVQDPETAEVPAMPAAALEQCPEARKTSLRDLAPLLQDLARLTAG